MRLAFLAGLPWLAPALVACIDFEGTGTFEATPEAGPTYDAGPQEDPFLRLDASGSSADLDASDGRTRDGALPEADASSPPESSDLDASAARDGGSPHHDASVCEDALYGGIPGANCAEHCASLDPVACKHDPRCSTYRAWKIKPKGDCYEAVEVGCGPTIRFCGGGVTLASDPKGQCYGFTGSCLPSGFVEHPPCADLARKACSPR